MLVIAALVSAVGIWLIVQAFESGLSDLRNGAWRNDFGRPR